MADQSGDGRRSSEGERESRSGTGSHGRLVRALVGAGIALSGVAALALHHAVNGLFARPVGTLVIGAWTSFGVYTLYRALTDTGAELRGRAE